MLPELTECVSSLTLGVCDASAIHDAVSPILSNAEIFGLDLYEVGLGRKVEHFLAEMLAGPGAVAATIDIYCK